MFTASSTDWRRLLTSVGPKAVPVLARCLGGPVLREICQTGGSSYVGAALLETGLARALGADCSLADALCSIFVLLRRAYRCEYVYRTAITNKLFLGRHSPANTTLLSELRVRRSKADLVMFNGTSVAYEIKTELDNLDRIGSQLEDYSSIFDRVFVVTHAAGLAAVLPVAPSHVGVIVLGPALTFSVKRQALSNADRVQPRMVVDALRRDEVLEVTRRVAGTVPSAPPVALIDACADLLEGFSGRAVHDAMVAVMKRRTNFTRDDLAGVPPELISAYLDSGLRTKEWSLLTQYLTQMRVGDVIRARGEVFPLPTCQTV